ncbi:MAG: hypothetical protein QM570_08190 [Planctomycetota bacterium]|nr:hypothetical protein [Planctomycetota bacterium]
MACDRMERVSRARPCPICGKHDWCLVAADGSAAICQRVEAGSLKKCGDAGFLHILVDRHDGHDRHRRGVRWRHVAKISLGQDASGPDFGRLSAKYQSQLTGEGFEALTRSLGLSRGGLLRLWVGWDGRAYTFPMSDASGEVIGIRRRFPNGKKASIGGSKNGLFIPTDLRRDGPLLICEGPTDTAAALDVGFDAIGRPNCNSLIAMTVRAAQGRDEIAVIADNDAAGRTGANRLANALALCCSCVRVIHPPDGVKDLRQWRGTGLTSETLQGMIAATRPIRMKVNLSRVDAGRRACS